MRKVIILQEVFRMSEQLICRGTFFSCLMYMKRVGPLFSLLSKSVWNFLCYMYCHEWVGLFNIFTTISFSIYYHYISCMTETKKKFLFLSICTYENYHKQNQPKHTNNNNKCNTILLSTEILYTTISSDQ